MNKQILIFLIPVLILFACGETTVTSDNTDQAVETGPIDPYGDPPGYTGDPFVEFPDVIGISIPGEEISIYEEETLSGTHFTVQISAATNEETALRLAESVSAEINYPVFIDHDSGYWKVRVGAFPAREDAADYTQVLVNMGFSDAWVTTREP